MVSRGGAKGNRFGGDWTSLKLDVVQKYLKGYTTALKSTPFRKLYIDAFAGTGYRELNGDGGVGTGQALLFPDLAAAEPQALLDGSARLALKTDPPFDEYLFIDKSAARCEHLESLKAEFPTLAGRIIVRRNDANAEIRRLCADDWSGRRAVLFLDPYGMEVEWTTIEAVARTQAMDLWLLFPLGIGVNRLLMKSGDIPASWRKRLNLLLGTEDWFEDLYRIEAEPDLFGNDSEKLVKVSTETIGRYFKSRLSTIFAGVAEKPAVLRNSTNNPLYLLCFAVGNTRGRHLALRIADHILLGVR
jgi:three-Cys-motif partner protein